MRGLIERTLKKIRDVWYAIDSTTSDPFQGWQDLATNHFLRITQYGDLSSMFASVI